MISRDKFRQDAPLLLTVPGLGNSGPTHWQSIWERERGDCRRVELGMWNEPHRNVWVNQLGAAIRAAARPVVLIAHSLGCHAVAWWNALERPGADGKVVGALLVAPPSVEGVPPDHPIAPFAPLVRGKLAFPSILAASRDDPYADFGQSKKMARLWGSRLADAGWLGHINAESAIGDWPFGQHLVNRLLWSVADDAWRRAGMQPRQALPSDRLISLSLD
jgi:predicted alpha/beta hydrolase family esterase